jgi:hypothetical protein
VSDRPLVFVVASLVRRIQYTKVLVLRLVVLKKAGVNTKKLYPHSKTLKEVEINQPMSVKPKMRRPKLRCLNLEGD